MSDWTKIISFTIHGEAASKANSRRSVPRPNGGGNLFIKSKGALSFERACSLQIPKLPTLLDEQGMEVWMHCRAVYPSLRSDLDMSIVYDQAQGRLYHDDVCVTLMTTSRAYDGDPRIDVVVHGRPWLIDGKRPVLRVNEPLRLAERAAILAAQPPATKRRRSGKL